jgi:hypothetical protein
LLRFFCHWYFQKPFSLPTPISPAIGKLRDIIAWSESAGGTAARHVAPIVIPARRYMEPTGHGAAGNTGLVTRILRGVIEFCFATSIAHKYISGRGLIGGSDARITMGLRS